ncbi:MAG: hypothetical protein K2H64_00945, partial [Desulfovibrio sp.]|nr:hypothetical protein [Desulfovibrio sp.]
MNMPAFDTLKYFEKLKESGVPENQAKVHVETIQDAIENAGVIWREDLTTKDDLRKLGDNLIAENNEIRDDLKV